MLRWTREKPENEVSVAQEMLKTGSEEPDNSAKTKRMDALIPARLAWAVARWRRNIPEAGKAYTRK